MKFSTLKPNIQSHRGFTLIELLVVIAIIGLLASTVLASLSSARSSARDAGRLSDIKQLQIALELYRNANNGLYPTTPTSQQVVNMTSGTSNITPYIKIPIDPTHTGSNGYRYIQSNLGAPRSSYTMLFQFENQRVNRVGKVIPANSWCSITGGSGNGYSTWNGMNDVTGVYDNSSYTPCF